MYIDH